MRSDQFGHLATNCFTFTGKKGRPLRSGHPDRVSELPPEVDALTLERCCPPLFPPQERQAARREVSVRLGHRPVAMKVVGVVREPFTPGAAYVPKRFIEELGGHADITNSLRLALERSTTREEAVQVIATLLERHGQGGSCSRRE